MAWSINTIVGASPKEEHLARAKILLGHLLSIRNSSQEGGWDDHFRGVERFLDFLSNPKDDLVRSIFEVVSRDRHTPWDFYQLVEYMYKHKDSDPRGVGDLFVTIVKHSSVVPNYPEDKIVEICQTLESAGQNDTLISICRAYSDRSPSCAPIFDVCSRVTEPFAAKKD